MVANYSKKYLPNFLSRSDKKKQRKMLDRSRKQYKKGKYISRSKVKTFKNKPSRHVVKAKTIYKIDKITPSKKLARATGCNVKTLKKIVNKGMGAYYSSGSRPNQTGHSWGIARLASAVTGGGASYSDRKELMKGCKNSGKAYKMMRSQKGSGTGTVKMSEKIIKFTRGPNDKKYTAHIKTPKNTTRVLHFGDKNYQQYKDRTPLKLYSSKNHGELRRQQNYYNRHSGVKNRKAAIQLEKRNSNGIYTPKLLSHIYLW